MSKQRPTGQITDDTPIWFGKYANEGLTFGEVPFDYFLNYLDGNCDRQVQAYIDENRDALEKEKEESRPSFHKH